MSHQDQVVPINNDIADLRDVITHRNAWRDALVKMRDSTNDDEGTGYYSHEIKAFDRTFDHLKQLTDKLTALNVSAGGQDRKYKFEDGHFVNRISGEPIPDDEPTVILRARDQHSLSTLKMYAYLINDEHHKRAVQDRIDEFEDFALKYPERMKEPGITGHMQLNNELGDPI